MVIFLPTTLISFTKLRFRQSFWGAQHAKILIGSKAMPKNTKGFISGFLPFWKKKAENICLINGHFKTSSGRFLANYTAVFLKTEDQMVILRCLTCLNLNWIKCYDIMLVKVFFFHACKCLNSGVLCEVSFWYLRTKSALIFSK